MLKRQQQTLKLWQHKPDAVLELTEIMICSLNRRFGRNLSCKVCFAEDSSLAVFAHAHIDRYFSAVFYS